WCVPDRFRCCVPGSGIAGIAGVLMATVGNRLLMRAAGLKSAAAVIRRHPRRSTPPIPPPKFRTFESPRSPGFARQWKLGRLRFGSGRFSQYSAAQPQTSISMNVPVFDGSCVFDIPSEIGCAAPEVPTFRQHIPGVPRSVRRAAAFDPRYSPPIPSPPPCKGPLPC
ncbi:MAG: hypothetical protein RLZZ232_1337, partial [Planctomycetota bacterium]